MIFAKIPIIVLFVLSATNTSESRNYHKGCSCAERSKPDITEEKSTTYNGVDNNDTEKHSESDHWEIDKNIIDDITHTSGMNKNFDLHRIDQVYPQVISNQVFDLKSNSPTHTYINKANHANMSPNMAAEMLKKLWLSHQILYQHNEKNPTDQISIPLHSPIAPSENFSNFTSNGFLNKLDGKKNSNELKFPPDKTLNENFKENMNRLISHYNTYRYGTERSTLTDYWNNPDNNFQNKLDDTQYDDLQELRFLPLQTLIDKAKTVMNKNNNNNGQNTRGNRIGSDFNGNGIDESIATLDKTIYPNQHDAKTIPLNAALFQHNIAYDKHNPQFLEEIQYRIPATYIAPNRKPTQCEPVKFCKWIFKQTEVLNNKNQGSNEVNLSGLGYSVLQVLHENGMYITDNGMLIDTYGTISNIDTLSLIPVIIRNTMSIKNVLQGKYRVKSSLLQKPYLQAILVTATHPDKILGIMPFGTTYKSSSLISVPSISNFDLGNSGIGKVETKNKPELQIKFKIGESNRNVYDGEEVKYVKEDYRDRLRNSISLRKRGLTPDDEDIFTDDHYYRIDQFQNEGEIDSRRLFIPHLEFHEQPIDILLMSKSGPASGQDNLSDISKLFHIALSSESLPVSAKTSKIAKISNRPASVTRVSESLENPAGAAMHSLNLLKKEKPLSVNGNILLDRPYQIPIQKWSISKQNPFLGQYRLSTIPILSDGLKISVDKEAISKSGGDKSVVPQSPPEVNSGNPAFDLVEGEDDSNDADFRIIGGNAATGSGTPLSNKGRSGFIF